MGHRYLPKFYLPPFSVDEITDSASREQSSTKCALSDIKVSNG